jgi:type III secretory pathway lipoprotein EscJ
MDLFRLTILCLLLILTGCSRQSVIDSTTQKRAVQVVVALQKRGITATIQRESGGQGKYSVSVKSSDYATALSIVESESLMEEPAPSVQELTSGSSFFPPSREMEALRLDHALAREVQMLIEELGGVSSARVVVRKRFSDRAQTSPSVSVVVRTEPGAQVAEPMISEIITRTIPGLATEHLLITIESSNQSATEASSVINAPGDYLVPFIFNWRVPRDDYRGFAILFLGLMTLVGFFGIGLGMFVGARRARSLKDGGDNQESTPRIERQRRDLLEG